MWIHGNAVFYTWFISENEMNENMKGDYSSCKQCVHSGNSLHNGQIIKIFTIKAM